MKKINHLNRLEAKLLNSEETKEINYEMAEEYLMADLYSGFTPSEESINK